jgi:chromate reductase
MRAPDRHRAAGSGIHIQAMNLLGVCGSLQRQSRNHDLLRVAARSVPDGVVLTLFDGLGELPLFNPDLTEPSAGAEPGPVTRWRQALQAADGLLIASPEYGHSLTGVLKNAIDWVIGTGELYQKVVAITAAVSSPERGLRGLATLRQTLQAVDAILVGGQPIVGTGEQDPQLVRSTQDLLAALVERAGRRLTG